MTKEEDDLLCDVSPGTRMSNAFKRNWLPVMRADQLEAGGAPVKFKLLCEDYVAFRANDGRIGVFAEKCPHRGCSLALAANRDNALTCIWHGWKFDVGGKCVETPNAPHPEFPSKVPLKYFRSREAGGMLWVYLAEGEPTRFPDYLFNRLKPEQVRARAAYVNYNWLTGVEAILDPAHVGVLHQNWVEGIPNGATSTDLAYQANDRVPRVEMDQKDWGFSWVSLRNAGPDKQYVRINEFVEPSGVFITQSSEGRKLFIMSVPLDNENSIQWYIWYSPVGELDGNDLLYALGNTDEDDADFYHSPKGKPAWGQDREAMMKGESFTGFTDIMFEDFIVGESMGARPDRSTEYLVPADIAIVKARKYFLDKLKAEEETGESQFGHTADFDFGALQSVGIILDNGTDWREVAKDEMKKRSEALAS